MSRAARLLERFELQPNALSKAYKDAVTLASNLRLAQPLGYFEASLQTQPGASTIRGYVIFSKSVPKVFVARDPDGVLVLAFFDKLLETQVVNLLATADDKSFNIIAEGASVALQLDSERVVATDVPLTDILL
jgi:hypothetical protein